MTKIKKRTAILLALTSVLPAAVYAQSSFDIGRGRPLDFSDASNDLFFFFAGIVLVLLLCGGAVYMWQEHKEKSKLVGRILLVCLFVYVLGCIIAGLDHEASRHWREQNRAERTTTESVERKNTPNQKPQFSSEVEAGRYAIEEFNRQQRELGEQNGQPSKSDSVNFGNIFLYTIAAFCAIVSVALIVTGIKLGGKSFAIHFSIGILFTIVVTALMIALLEFLIKSCSQHTESSPPVEVVIEEINMIPLSS